MAGRQQQQQQQQQGQSSQGCEFMRNMFQNCGQNQGCGQQRGGFGGPRGQFLKNMFQSYQQQQQATQPEAEKKEDKKEEKKMEEEPKGNQDKVISNAQHLAQYGFDFTKCYFWAKTYPQLSQEELLEMCLSSEKFLNPSE